MEIDDDDFGKGHQTHVMVPWLSEWSSEPANAAELPLDPPVQLRAWTLSSVSSRKTSVCKSMALLTRRAAVMKWAVANTTTEFCRGRW